MGQKIMDRKEENIGDSRRQRISDDLIPRSKEFGLRTFFVTQKSWIYLRGSGMLYLDNVKKIPMKCTFSQELLIIGERRVIGISGPLIWSKTPMELIFNAYGEFR